MNTESKTLTRREVLLSALRGTVAAAVAAPVIVDASTVAPVVEPEFVPENDYPFFGFEPDQLLRS